MKARAIFSQADEGSIRIYVPAPVLAEVIMVAEKGRLPGVTVERVLPCVEAMRESGRHWPCPLFPSTVLRSHSLKAIPDIFDRLIVAEALYRNCPLITRDPEIRAAGVVTTIWG